MRARRSASSAPLREPDRVRVAVAVRTGGQPIAPARWTYRRSVSAGTAAGVVTTWRDLLLASASVGRSVAGLCALYPGFAVPELRARVDALRTGLGAGTDRAGNPVAAPSDWLVYGSDRSESAAVSYRVGMAAAHWTAFHMLGVGQTVHVDSLPAKDPRRTAKRPDLIGKHPVDPPHDWLIEAKGGFYVTPGARRAGSEQLHSPARAGWSQPHVHALVSASLDPFLHVVVDIEERVESYTRHDEDSPRQHFAGQLLARVTPGMVASTCEPMPGHLRAPVDQIMASRITVNSGGPIGYLEPKAGR